MSLLQRASATLCPWRRPLRNQARAEVAYGIVPAGAA
eukprot:CAMPEP_0194333526 /NCGR_PEP_ID=MMETSP0171-20130528/62977_1 /TAXON_ID=218684 /ORGANISM="Corethron pennatum, Strain L29A3" /LENGTH=36 /DNA_ID= /DNA_START= /DNA_END= /DNA_ORIENTATION=